MIAGLEEIAEGEIAIGDTVVNRVPPKERDIAMVFQNYALYPHMTVRDNMSFALMLAKQPKAEIEARVQKAADILGLAPYLDRYPRQLSGGQRQRVAMGRAIVRDPQVFLFDEPLSNLDAKLRVQMRTEIKELHQRLKTTSIYVTHDQIEAMTMADKIVVMRDGVVEQTGDPLDALRPSGEHVRRRLHRLAGDEHDPGHRARNAGGGCRRIRRRRRAAGAGGCARRRRPARCSTACVPSTARSARPGCRWRSSSSSRPAPTRSSTAASTARKSRRRSTIAPTAVPGDRIHLAPDLARAHLFDAASGSAARRVSFDRATFDDSMPTTEGGVHERHSSVAIS